jgi:uncharacterized linocin/CFP29 family protein
LKENIDYPDWMKEEGLKTLKRQHLLDNETPKEMYERIVKTLSETLFSTTNANQISVKEYQKFKQNGLNICGKDGFLLQHQFLLMQELTEDIQYHVLSKEWKIV